MNDYDYLNKYRDTINSRRSAQWPDEEPDIDSLSYADRERAAMEQERADRAETETRKDRGLERTPQ